MPDSSDIDNALVAKLGADTTLLSYCPNGVYMGEAPPGATRYVIVSIVDAVDEPVFGQRGYEDILYVIEARALSTANGNVKAAAARIEALLEDQPLNAPGSPQAPVAGYTWMTTHRDGRPPGAHDDEVDAVDTALRWKRRAAYYRVQMAVT